jgi:hypothetical protein
MCGEALFKPHAHLAPIQAMPREAKSGIVGSACVHPNRNFLNVFRLFLPVQIFFEKFSAFLLRQIDGEYWSIRNQDERSDM